MIPRPDPIIQPLPSRHQKAYNQLFRYLDGRPDPRDDAEEFGRRVSASLLNRIIYRLPDPFDTQSQYETSVHADLVSMTPFELCQELRRVRLRLLLEKRPPSWLHERAAAVQHALRTRRTQR